MLDCLLPWVCMEFGLGASHAHPADCGIWYMCGPQYPHTIIDNSASASVGFVGKRWRFGLEYLGRFAVDGLAISSTDPTLIGCAPKCFPISYWAGAGTRWGMLACRLTRLGLLLI